MRQFLLEVREYGLAVAWFNVKFSLCKKWLGATHMEVRTDADLNGLSQLDDTTPSQETIARKDRAIEMLKSAPKS